MREEFYTTDPPSEILLARQSFAAYVKGQPPPPDSGLSPRKRSLRGLETIMRQIDCLTERARILLHELERDE